MKSTEFVDYVVEDLLGSLDVVVWQMFGGYGLYQRGIIFGIVVRDELYLKVDHTNQEKYKDMGSTPFQYLLKNGKKASMSYWKIPYGPLENREVLISLVEESIAINRIRLLKNKLK